MEIVAEEWRPVVGRVAGSPYEVSSLGRVRRIGRSKILATFLSHSGYPVSTLSHNGKANHVKLHRLVAERFVEGMAPGLEVNHINGNKRDNRAENLEWVTHRANMEHALATGLQTKPLSHYTRKFTMQQAADIRTLIRRGVSQEFLSRWFGVCHGAINNIYRGRSYI